MKQKGIQLAIASSSSKKDILKMAESNEILIYFDQIVSVMKFLLVNRILQFIWKWSIV